MMTEDGKKYVDALLQQDGNIIINGEEYKVPAPTYATLIRLSAYINEAEIESDIEKVNFADLILLAKDESSAPFILATLILGAKECDKPYFEDVEVEITEEVEETKYLLGFIPRVVKSSKTSLKKETIQKGTKFENLSQHFLNDVPISDVVRAIIEIINNRLDLGFFWNGITYLKGMNHTKRTKEI